VAGTTLECTLAADTTLSSINTTPFAAIALPSGSPPTLSLPAYTGFSLCYLAPFEVTPFWQMRI
jgi:hypothetical protein